MEDKNIFSESYYSNSPGYPSEERLRKGKVAIIECVEEIPCNVCEIACRKGAIRVGKPITNLPELIEEKCTGCGQCIPGCPGLAIFCIDNNYSKTHSTISLPYEFLPLPEKGQIVFCLNRSGKEICKGMIVRVVPPEKNNHTAIVTVAILKRYSGDVRWIKIKRKK